jgi:outer membrane protein TolC
MKKIRFSIFLIALLLLSYLVGTVAQGEENRESTFIQSFAELKPKEFFKPLTLNDVIEEGLRENYNQKIRDIETDIDELNWQDTSSDFWIPKLQMTLTTTEQRVGRLSLGSKQESSTPTDTYGALNVGFSDYTIFNWGRDYLDYLNSKNNYLRSKDSFIEKRRELKHNLIIKYFELLKIKKIEKIKKIQLRHASFIYRLNQERATLKKIPAQDYLLARGEYLRAQNEFYESRINSEQIDQEMANLLADEPGTRYILKEKLDYRKIKTTFTEVADFSVTKNPNVLQAEVDVENAERDYQKNLKDNLPLPKVTMNFGAYSHAFGNGENHASNDTALGNQNIELVAAINATWSLTGSGGLFNSRKTKLTVLNKYLADENLRKNKHEATSSVRLFYNQILSDQTQIDILEPRINNLQKTFDIILENYINSKSDFSNLHNTLKELSEIESFYEDTKFNQLKYKVLLAGLMGLDDFPGEKFEDLAKKDDKTWNE